MGLNKEEVLIALLSAEKGTKDIILGHLLRRSAISFDVNSELKCSMSYYFDHRTYDHDRDLDTSMRLVHVAAKMGLIHTFEELKNLGADINALSTYYFINHKYYTRPSTEEGYREVTRDSHTPLDLAILYGHEDCIGRMRAIGCKTSEELASETTQSEQREAVSSSSAEAASSSTLSAPAPFLRQTTTNAPASKRARTDECPKP